MAQPRPIKEELIKAYRVHHFEFKSGNDFYLVKWEEKERSPHRPNQEWRVSFYKWEETGDSLNPFDWSKFGGEHEVSQWLPTAKRSTMFLNPML